MNIPTELTALPQWVLWRNERGQKIPRTIRGENAENDNPETWWHYTPVQTKWEMSQGNGNPYSGIGFVFASTDPFVGIDVDGCRNPETGEITEWAQSIIDACQTYTEVSPSGTGVKLFCRGKLNRATGINRRLPEMPVVSEKTPGIEIFEKGKYFTVTGRALEGLPIACVDCQPAIDSLVAKYATPERPASPSTTRVAFTGSQADVWKRYCAYVAKMPDAIEGQGGGTLTFIAMKVAVGFGFEGDDLRRAFDYWNDTKCKPKWTSESQIAHKISEGIKYGNFGALRDAWQEGDDVDVDLAEFLNAASVELFPAETPAFQVANERLPQLSAERAADLDEKYGEQLRKLGVNGSVGTVVPSDTTLPPGETETVVIHAPPVAAPLSLHDTLYNVPGFVNQLIDYTLSTAPYPNLPMAFCGALSLLSVLTARRVIGPTGLYTNIYTLALANSGSGKDHPRKVNSQLLSKVNLDNRLIERAASGQGLEDALFASPELLAQADEFDSILVSINRPADAIAAELASKYLVFYSAAQHTYRMRIKANEPRRSIPHPHLSLYGTCVPREFFNNLTPKLLSNGLVARMLVVESGERGRGQHVRWRPIPQSILDVAEYWRDFNPGGGDISQFTGANPREIEYDDDAQQIFADALSRQDDHYIDSQKKGDDASCSVWARAWETAHKLAVLYACSEDHRNPIVGEPAATWATEFSFRQAAWLLAQVDERAGEESKFEKVANRVLLSLKKGGGRILHSKALHDSKVDKTEYQKVIETLVARGEVKTEKEGKATYLCKL